MFWSAGANPDFRDVGGEPSGGSITATVKHFSARFVGRKLREIARIPGPWNPRSPRSVAARCCPGSSGE
jgi:hypothetical protein